MKVYILMKNETEPETAEDIKVEDIYGIYQNRCKGFWECKVANLKISKENQTNCLSYYILKEINLESSEIIQTYNLIDRNNIIDSEKNIFKVPVFYSDIETDYNTSNI